MIHEYTCLKEIRSWESLFVLTKLCLLPSPRPCLFLISLSSRPLNNNNPILFQIFKSKIIIHISGSQASKLAQNSQSKILNGAECRATSLAENYNKLKSTWHNPGKNMQRLKKPSVFQTLWKICVGKLILGVLERSWIFQSLFISIKTKTIYFYSFVSDEAGVHQATTDVAQETQNYPSSHKSWKVLKLTWHNSLLIWQPMIISLN